MKKYKVWGGITHQKGNQVRTIVATTSKKRAVEILNEYGHNISYYYFNDYWCKTGNKHEIKLAVSQPETIFYMG